MSEPIKSLVKKASPLPPEVPIDVPETEVANISEAASAMSRLGLSAINARVVVDMAKVGVFMKGVGIVPGQHGSAYVSQAQIKETMDALTKRIRHLAGKKDKIADRAKEIDKLNTLARSLGYLAEKLSKSNKVVLDSCGESGQLPSIPPPAPTKSFRPGQRIGAPPETKVVVQSGGTLHISQQPPAA